MASAFYAGAGMKVVDSILEDVFEVGMMLLIVHVDESFVWARQSVWKDQPLRACHVGCRTRLTTAQSHSHMIHTFLLLARNDQGVWR